MLDPKNLAALVAIAEQGQMRLAAQTLSLTVAAVSMRIRALESQVGQRLLVRGKTLRLTQAGQRLMAYYRKIQALESDVMADLDFTHLRQPRQWQTLCVAVNADSVAQWFLPGVAKTLMTYRLLLDITVDDQDHTHAALQSGQVLGCVTTLDTPMQGCVAEPLGQMVYQCVASERLLAQCRDEDGKIRIHDWLAQPAILFNRKDKLQDLFLEKVFGLKGTRYPKHFVPAVDAFEEAIALGLGWGMMPVSRQTTRWKPMASTEIAVQLYWQHWQAEPEVAKQLTQAVLNAAKNHLKLNY